MATMATCPSCNNKISPKAFDCPSCGHPLRKPKRGVFGTIFKWLLIIFNVLMLLWIVMGLAGNSDLASTATSDAERAGVAIGTGIAVTGLLVIWVLGNVILGLPTLLTRPRK